MAEALERYQPSPPINTKTKKKVASFLIKEEKMENNEISANHGTRGKTYGEKAVGITFNPGGYSNPADDIKNQYAAIIDRLNEERDRTADGEQKRLLSVAITEAQTAQMWAVKGITWGI
ncbi:hypothetical protein FWH13_03050 [Candidatus Saccharibacteria bacterium]|nr:hypothetical protein [Candidatus Saccharibacteria bacterium]